MTEPYSVQLPLENPRVQTAIWGLRPFSLQAGKPPPINARAETLDPSPMYREAARCLIPMGLPF
jgi:putative SOS response-associated peptidase YedK